MSLPSKKKLEEHFGQYFRHEGIDPKDGARQIRTFMEAMFSSASGLHGGAHDATDKILDFVNTFLKGHGVEAIRGNYQVNRYYYDIVALYVNFGDPYVPTLLYETDTGRWQLTNWGDWVERNGKKYEIE